MTEKIINALFVIAILSGVLSLTNLPELLALWLRGL